MKKRVLILSVVLATQLIAKDVESVEKEGLKYIKMLGKELKGKLKAKMKEDPSGVEAFEFCANNAEKITQEVNSKFPKGVTVRRASLKVRNEKNSPDPIDTKVLDIYQEMAKEGKLTGKSIKTIELDNSKRVYKPLLTKKVCLKCHGDLNSLNPKIKELISKKYPHDSAVGFKEGDLRGVIVSEITK
jgi:hypothetical protein